MNDNNNKKESMINIVKNEGISAIWLVPIIAILFGGYLGIKAYLNHGVMIQIQFNSAESIVAGETEVRYKGLTVGRVTHVDITPNLQHVIANVEMIKSATDVLTENTEFWLVSADVSLDGISGLNTLLTGSYIAMKPDISFSNDHAAASTFVALKEEPPLDNAIPGLHIVLQTKELGSLHKSSPVLHKQIEVGRVINYRFNAATDNIDVDLFIEPEYVNLVNPNTRFWNASGFEISGNLTSGLEVKTRSLASIISGGIAFNQLHETDNTETLKPVQNGTIFDLHKDYNDAKLGYEIELSLSLDSGIDIGDPIIYEGITVGKLEKLISISPENKTIMVMARVDPRVKRYLTDNTQFFVVEPKIDLSGVTYVNALMRGAYVGVRPSFTGALKTKFAVSNNTPAISTHEPGLHLTLLATEIPSLQQGSKVFYKNKMIGDIQAINNTQDNQYAIAIHIKPGFQHLVNSASKFYNASGVRVSGNLQGFEFQTSSLQSILMGGITFENNDKNDNTAAVNGDEFQLYDNRDRALESKEFELNLLSSKHINIGTRIIYRGEKVGSVHRISRNQDRITLTVGVFPEFDFILQANSKFWLVSPEMTLSGVSDTDALFGGAYITFSAGDGPTKTSFNVLDSPPSKPVTAEGLQLSLNALTGSVASSGSPVSFRGIIVGQVDNAELNKTGDNVAVNITIDNKYKHLINENTRFYNAGGVTITGSVGDFSIDTESMDTIIRGGVSFYNTDEIEDSRAISEGESFTLFENEHSAKAAGIFIKIHFKDVAGLRQKMKVKYQDQEIGFVERIHFNNADNSATVYAYLNDSGKNFAVKGTQFWLAKLKLGLVNTKNVNTLIEGNFIKVAPGNGAVSTDFIAVHQSPVVKKRPYGLNITLRSPQLGSINVGNPILYKQVIVGEVIGVDLSATADFVDIYVNILDRYIPLVKQQSQFWNTSGFKVDAGIFSGVNITSESIETILSGGIAFATPEPTKNAPLSPAVEFSTFDLAAEPNENWYKWRPKINLNHE